MKFSLLFLAALLPLATHAQSNLPLPGLMGTNSILPIPTNAPPKDRPPIRIKSDNFVLFGKDRLMIYSNNVMVTDPQMKMTCDVLTAKAPTNTTQIRIENVIAEGRVKIVGEDDDGKPVNVVCDKAIYFYNLAGAITNETLTLTGNVYVDSAMFKGSGEPIIWDRTHNTIHGQNTDMQFQTDPKHGTNSPAKKLLL